MIDAEGRSIRTWDVTGLGGERGRVRSKRVSRRVCLGKMEQKFDLCLESAKRIVILQICKTGALSIPENRFCSF